MSTCIHFPFLYLQNDAVGEDELIRSIRDALRRNGVRARIWSKRRPELRSVYGVQSPGLIQLWTDRVANLQPIATLLSEWRLPPGPMPVFELHIPYLLHFMEQTGLVGMAWLPLTSMTQVRVKTTRCALEYEVDWQKVVEYSKSQTQNTALTPIQVMTARGSVEKLYDKDWLLKGLRSLWVEEGKRCDTNGLPSPDPPPPTERSPHCYLSGDSIADERDEIVAEESKNESREFRNESRDESGEVGSLQVQDDCLSEDSQSSHESWPVNLAVNENPDSFPPNTSGYGWYVFHRPPPPYSVSHSKMSRDCYGRVTFSSPLEGAARVSVDFGTVLSVEVIVLRQRLAVVVYTTGEDRGAVVNRELVDAVDDLKCLDASIIFANCEKDVVQCVEDIFHRLDPQVVVSYDIHNGLGRIIKGKEAMARFSRSLLSPVPVENTSQGDTQAADARRLYPIDHLTGGVSLTGRIVLSLWRVLRSEAKLNTTELSTACESVLGFPIPRYSEETLERWLTGRNKTAALDALKWCLRKADMNLALLEKLDILQRAAEMAKLFGCDVFSIFLRGSQYRVESVLLRAAHAHNYVLLSPTRRQVRAQPAMQCMPLVLEPASNFYWDPVIVLDFQSLYPSIVIAYNICYTTCLGIPETQRLGVVEPYTPSDLPPNCSTRATPNGAVFRTDIVGVLPRMLQEILQTRIMIKRSLKAHQQNGKETPAMMRLLDARQFGLKMIANVTYGYTSASFSGRMPCAEIADAIVQTARRTLEKAFALAEELYKDKIEVVYGDTDSLFIRVCKGNLEEAFRIGQDLANHISFHTPWPMELKFEKVYYPCLLLTKKRYCGMMYTSPEGPGTLDAKGIETVRRDQCAWTVKVMDDVLSRMFTMRDANAARQCFADHVRKLRQHLVPLNELLFFRETRRREDYMVLPPHCYVGTELIPGKRVAYGIERSHGNPNELLIQKARPPDAFRDPDTEYYIFKHIVPALQRAFGLLGEDVALWADTSRQRSLPPAFHRWTRDAQKCISCGADKSGDLRLCPECIRLGSRHVWHLPALQTERALQRRKKKAVETCTACTLLPSECANFTCAVWGERIVAKKECGRMGKELRGIKEICYE